MPRSFASLPIVVDPEGMIVCGSTRFKAAQKLGLTEVPVHVARDLSPEQLRAYRLVDNRTVEIADWNLDLLPLELAELQSAEYDLSLLGFSVRTSSRGCSARNYRKAYAIRTKCRRRLTKRSPSRETCGYSASTSCCAASRRSQTISIGF